MGALTPADEDVVALMTAGNGVKTGRYIAAE
jgi:hypothetical protein